jgi:hypothetical protein
MQLALGQLLPNSRSSDTQKTFVSGFRNNYVFYQEFLLSGV